MKQIKTLILFSLTVIAFILALSVDDEYEIKKEYKKDVIKVHKYSGGGLTREELIDAIASGSKLTKADAG